MSLDALRSIRAELSKSFVGLWMIPAYAVAALIPWVIATNLASAVAPGDIPGAVLDIAATASIGSAFVGTWVVTRDYYYHSLSRSVVVSGRAAVFIGKTVTAFVVGAIAAAAAILAWVPFGAAVLGGDGAELTADGQMIARVAGILVTGSIAGAFGGAIAWLVPNYFGASILAIALPLVVEIVPAIGSGRALPGLPTSAAAGISGVQLDGGLPLLVNAAVLVAWTTAFIAAGWLAFRRREI